MSLHMVLLWASSETFQAAANFADFSVIFCHLCGLAAWSLFLSASSLSLCVWAESSQALVDINCLSSFPLYNMRPRNPSFRHVSNQSPLPLCLYRKADIRRDETWAFIAWNYTNSVATPCHHNLSPTDLSLISQTYQMLSAQIISSLLSWFCLKHDQFSCSSFSFQLSSSK